MNKQLFISCLFTLCLVCVYAQSQRPHIILINVDDLGWRDIGFMGSQYYETPHIDTLAKQAMVFTQAYASAANCAPSRASMMTGLWQQRHGIYTVNSSERGPSKARKIIPTPNITILDTTKTTLAQVLQTTGYRTCIAGKWHLSEDPTDYGFDVNIGGGIHGGPKSYDISKTVVTVDSGQSDYLTDVIMEHALDFVDSVDGPMFLYYAPYAVHAPIMAKQSYLEKYQQKAPWNGQAHARYATMIENLDRNIGLLLDLLRQKQMLEDVLIIFTSDNGGHFGFTKQRPLRAGKGSYYEGGIRVPLFVYWPSTITQGTINETPVSNLDFFPTLMDVFDLNVNVALDGNSLLPLLKGETDSLNRPMFWHFPIYLQAYNRKQNENRDPFFRTRPGSVVRMGDWKLHYYFEDQDIELFNLSTDISERQNVAYTYPEKADDLLKLLEAWWRDTDAPIPHTPNPLYQTNEPNDHDE